MKSKIIILFLLMIGCSVHKKIIGKYFDNFGSEYKINSNSTFEYHYGLDTFSAWSKGKWEFRNDTIYFTTIPIYDTLKIVGHNDSLLLSRTKTPKLIIASSLKEIIWPESYGEQSVFINRKLYYKDDKLFKIDSKGNLIIDKKQQPHTKSTEKFDPWFAKKKQ